MRPSYGRAMPPCMRRGLHPDPAVPTPPMLQVLRAVARGMTRLLLPQADIPTQCPSFTISSELLAATVLRPVMMFCTP